MQEGFDRDLNPGVSRRVEPVPPISTCLICDYAGGLGLNGQGGMLVGPENPVFAGSSRSFTTSRRRKCYAWPTSMDCMHICTEDREHFNLHTQTQTHAQSQQQRTPKHTPWTTKTGRDPQYNPGRLPFPGARSCTHILTGHAYLPPSFPFSLPSLSHSISAVVVCCARTHPRVIRGDPFGPFGPRGSRQPRAPNGGHMFGESVAASLLFLSLTSWHSVCCFCHWQADIFLIHNHNQSWLHLSLPSFQ